MSLPHILVVDDSPSLRRMTGACLRAGGFTVTEAADGKEAHEVAMEEQFGMLVTDQVMPVMDGLSLIRALRATPAYASIPILMLSTEHDDRILDQAREAGASGFLAKPFDPEDLLASVHALLDPPTEG
ncbi:Chemotaxis regulator - transmits chemoreceptor signals to flagellar motor components CheY [Cupriavidus sp. U2]|uniref:response regulator n=1 Tax=Cupriavidus sp. U2 TaxID=2920269 RepID=UPI00129D66A2|nr:response regulator [Cupriavidus sp. U2]KAI3592198.1 Chemotaxis regulator - transmits chemoreceptor signals to flagellar motor components CheY [Cupriavidus sp. U2]